MRNIINNAQQPVEGNTTVIENDKTQETAPGRPSQAAQVIELIEPEINLFHDNSRNTHAMVKINERVINLPIESQQFLDWIAQTYWTNFRKVLNSNSLKECIGILRAKARFEGSCHRTFMRVGCEQGSIYIDLANEKGECIEINAQEWKIITNPPVKFIRTDCMRALTSPERGGDLNELFQFINISPASEKLVIAWILDCLRVDTPYPLLVLIGPQGSAKSTTQEFLRELIDTAEPNLRGAPRKIEDLMVAAANNHLVSLNNISSLSAQQQDDLCCMSTRGGYSILLENIILRTKNRLLI